MVKTVAKIVNYEPPAEEFFSNLLPTIPNALLYILELQVSLACIIIVLFKVTFRNKGSRPEDARF
jgi:hypothetical protein